MGKSAGEGRTEAEGAQHAQEEDDVRRRTKENRSSTAGALGEGKSHAEEVGVENAEEPQPIPFPLVRGCATG